METRRDLAEKLLTFILRRRTHLDIASTTLKQLMLECDYSMEFNEVPDEEFDIEIRVGKRIFRGFRQGAYAICNVSDYETSIIPFQNVLWWRYVEPVSNVIYCFNITAEEIEAFKHFAKIDKLEAINDNCNCENK